MKQISKVYFGDDLSWAEVLYVGQQERIGKFSLDMFTDLKTLSTFLRMENETIEEARDRIRRGYKK